MKILLTLSLLTFLAAPFNTHGMTDIDVPRVDAQTRMAQEAELLTWYSAFNAKIGAFFDELGDCVIVTLPEKHEFWQRADQVAGDRLISHMAHTVALRLLHLYGRCEPGDQIQVVFRSCYKGPLSNAVLVDRVEGDVVDRIRVCVPFSALSGWYEPEAWITDSLVDGVK